MPTKLRVAWLSWIASSTALVGQAEPLLQEVQAQHARHADGLTPHTTARRVLRLDQRLQPCPWHDSLYFTEKRLAPRDTLLLGRDGCFMMFV